MTSEFLARIMEASSGNGRVRISGEWSTWRQVFAQAQSLAGRLQSNYGVGPGSRVAVLGDTSTSVVSAITAVWLAGGALTVMQQPARRENLESYVERLRLQSRAARHSLVLLDGPYAPLADNLSAGTTACATVDQILESTPAPWVSPDVTNDSTALIHFTSGTTGAAKAVCLTHGNIASNTESIKLATDHEVNHACLVSWLPLSHDMGLIGFLALPLTCGECDLILDSPATFIRNPKSWIENLSQFGGTATAAPGFGYRLGARYLERATRRLDLSHLRVALCGGERITEASVGGFARTAAAYGLSNGSIMPAYGLAEATLAVTLVAEGQGATFVRDPRPMNVEVENGGRGRFLAKLGSPVPFTRIRIVGTDGGSLPATQIGEVQISGGGVTPGYLTEDKDLFDEGWLRSGDLGYLSSDDQLVICGRAKDLICRGGVNYFSEDFEEVLGGLDGVLPGAVAALRSEQGHEESIVIAVESSDILDFPAIRRSIRDRLVNSFGVVPDDIVAVPPKWLPKTPSGKLQRSLAAEKLGLL